ncbi:GntR family transcriptional regulator [Lactobacillus sp. ESL0684]|uniref:GntR family transcriptional regulator n=1 Tax=Lactobacillus sp. ESL0684 TaxID=2983213 RepID=UPI0023F78A85|nr:GntR family transcriptional regulator [Lactobacillus sp. ESL0684]WEV43413.1 GntR family transcriptional regulator [Lactobacillus sp. ESL0684]
MTKTGSLYSQVMEKIRQKIISGEYPINSKLPNEFALCEQFGVSRVTLRKAIKGLVKDGLVEKVQGVGTFVRKPQTVRRIVKSSRVESFSKTAKKEGFNPSAKTIEIKEVITPDDLKDVLETERSLMIERVHLIEDDPVMLECNYFPLPKFGELRNEDLTLSLYQVLHNKYGIKKLSSSDVVISIALANYNEAKYLEKSLGFPLLMLKATVVDEKGNIVHVGRQYIDSNRYEFHI